MWILLRDSVRFWVQRVLVPLVTAVGLFGNLLTTFVMCRPRMRTSSTHIYLAALALMDALYLSAAFLLSLLHYPNMKIRLDGSSRWKTFYWHCYPALVTSCDFASNTSIWLTVFFTIERYIVIRYPLRGKIVCTRSRAIKMILLLATICFLITLPTWWEWQVEEIQFYQSNQVNSSSLSEDESFTRFQITESTLGSHPTYRAYYNWISGLGFAFLPLTILTVFNLFLIRSVQKSGRKRKQWIREQTMSRTTTTTTSVRSVDYGLSVVKRSSASPLQQQRTVRVHRDPVSEPPAKRYSLSGPSGLALGAKQQSSMATTRNHAIDVKRNSITLPAVNCNRTVPEHRYKTLLRQDAHITRLLIAVVLFFLLCQLPSAVVTLYNACVIPTTQTQRLILQILGNVFNLFVSVNSAGNFVLYCLLSRRYRQTLREIFLPFRNRKSNLTKTSKFPI